MMRWRHLRDIVLLPIALVVVVLEDVIWAGLRALLRLVADLPAVRRVAAWLGTLPGWAALPMFLIPEAIGRIGDVWAVALLVQGQVVAAGVVYLLVRLVSTLLAVFVYHACEAALLRYQWFAAVVAWFGRVRDWALGIIAPWREAIRALLGRGRSRLGGRLLALRRVYAVGRFRAPEE